MMNRSIPLLSLLCAVTLPSDCAQSEESASTSRPVVVVTSPVSVRGAAVTLGEIAQISATAPDQAELVSQLKDLSLGSSPAPRQQATLPGTEILAKIVSAGIAAEEIGYSIPNEVTIRRDARLVTGNEVLRMVREQLDGDASLDLQVREVTWTQEQVIPIGDTEIRVERLGAAKSGKLPLRVDVFVEREPVARFLATALVDDWREIPVLERSVERGKLISPEDVQMVRLNLLQQPEDVIESLEELIGRRATSTIRAGETIRKRMIELPPVIAKGKRVTMSYGRGALFLTATGVALENGQQDELIRLKNESSGRVVRGKVLTPDEVEVAAQ